MNAKEIIKALKTEANDVKDRLEDLIDCYESGTVDEVIKEQQEYLKKINKEIQKLEGEIDDN